MKALNYSIEIAASRARVFACMLEDATYRDWTAAFCPGSYYEGEWQAGAQMRFLGPHEGGMRALIEEVIAPEYVSIQHLGELRDGAATDGDDWVGAFERYRLYELPNAATRLDIELRQVPADYVEMMNRLWPKALERLRQICELADP